MSIEIYQDTKIYVAAPANAATGGPELLHQLVYHLRKDLGIDAFVFYYPNNHPDPIPSEYKHYNVPFVREIEDKEENILIVPEVTSGIKLLHNYSTIRKVLWWLSVDNFYLSALLSSRKNFFFRRAINKLSRLFFNKPVFDIGELALKKIKKYSLQDFKEIIEQVDFHLVQSYYAMMHLQKNNIPKNKIFYLSDYLNEDFLKINTDLSKKENIVVYNPKKGFVFTRKIIKKAPDIKFVPIVNMTRKQVIETLQRAKVYIDFGNHPGKDRIPREAAILGCCVITGMRGSAKYFEDVPIPNEYKFEDKEENIPRIIDKIRECFENYEKKTKDFESYREIIKSEPEKFIEDLKKIFGKYNDS